MNIDKGLVTGSVFIDLAKAFDTVDHDILLSKLEYYGVCGESLPWFKNYLTGRKQFVHNDSQSSEEFSMASGVPQGSIFIIQIEYTANKNRQTLSQPKPWCNDSHCAVLNLHHGYYTTITTSRRLFRHNPVSSGINQPIRKSEFVQCIKFE